MQPSATYLGGMETTAATILAQLGGSKFLAMTGATIGWAEGQITVSLPRKSPTGAKSVRIALDYASDTYGMQSYAITSRDVLTLEVRHDVYADQLVAMFESMTGLRCSL